jgi:signal transduction histidine kinase
MQGAGAIPSKAMSQQSFNRVILAVLGSGLVVMFILGCAGFWLSVRARDYSHWVDHTYQAQSKIIALQAAVEQAETARRGYLLSPQETQREHYSQYRAGVTSAVFDLSSFVRDNPVQVAAIDKMRPLLNWKFNANEQTIALARAGQTAQARALFAQEQGLQPLVGIRRILIGMLGEERRLLTIRAAREQANTDLISAVTIAAAVLLGLLSSGAILVMRRYAGSLETAQVELRLLNESLERRVVERTEELSRANDEIQRFAYIVSHDLRSPLVNVMGFTSELEVGLKPLKALVDWIKANAPDRLPETVRVAVEEELPESIGFIRAATRKMDRLINAILKLSREGRRNLSPEPLSMNALVENLIASVRHQLDAKGAAAEIEGDLPNLVNDRVAIEQVLGNLFDNAVKYLSPKRPGRIVVRGGGEGARLFIEVEDNGRGVDPRDHERIFELFRRSGVQDQPGEGIGLAHVRALVYRLGGTISCTSELDRGSTFRISLPKVLSHKEGMAA